MRKTLTNFVFLFLVGLSLTLPGTGGGGENTLNVTLRQRKCAAGCSNQTRNKQNCGFVASSENCKKAPEARKDMTAAAAASAILLGKLLVGFLVPPLFADLKSSKILKIEIGQPMVAAL